MENYRFTFQQNQFTSECLPCTAAQFKSIVNSADVNRKVASRQAIEEAIVGGLPLDNFITDKAFQVFCQKQSARPKAGEAFAALPVEQKLLQWGSYQKQWLPCFIFAVSEFAALPRTDSQGCKVLFRRRLLSSIEELSGMFMFDADHLPCDPRDIYERTLQPGFSWQLRLAHKTSSGHGLRLVCEAKPEVGNIADNQIELARELGLLGMKGTTGKPVTDDSCIDATRISYAPRMSDIYFIDEDNMFYMSKQNKSKEFNEKFLGSYQQSQTDPTDKEHHFDADAQVANPATDAATTQPQQPVPPSVATGATIVPTPMVTAYGHPVIDFINMLLPDGAPVGSRHKMAIKLAYDLLIVCDSDKTKVLSLLEQLPWVKAIVAERGEKELDDIMDAAAKLTHKRESENFNDLLPSKNMRRAIEKVTGRKFSSLVKELHRKLLGTTDDKNNVTAMLERIGAEIEKLFPYFEYLRLLCYRLQRKYYVVALFVGGAFAMTLATRCWYWAGMEPGKRCRLNSVLELIGRSGSGKQIAVALYRIMMTPVKKGDEAQKEALNRWNEERDQKSGGEKNRTPRPAGIMRCMPSETSAAAIREAEFNAKEMIDGEEWPLHVFQFNSELDDLIDQMKKGYMNIEKLFLKGFHNEPDGAYLKTASSKVGEYDVHFNAVYSGTPDALRKQTTKENFAKGRLFRITAVPLADSDFEPRKRHVYDDKDRARDNALLDWAYRFDACKGEIPCEDIDIALCKWTARRIADAEDNDRSLALEDMAKRPYWHALNFSLPFIVSRHWDQMVEDGGRYKCSPDFKTDKYDRQLALLIVNAHYAFQQHFFLGVGEQYYDNQEAEQASHVRHQQKTLLGYRRLPQIFTLQDVDQCFGYGGNKNSVHSKMKRLIDDGLAQKIRTGADKGKYKKLQA